MYPTVGAAPPLALQTLAYLDAHDLDGACVAVALACLFAYVDRQQG